MNRYFINRATFCKFDTNIMLGVFESVLRLFSKCEKILYTSKEILPYIHDLVQFPPFKDFKGGVALFSVRDNFFKLLLSFELFRFSKRGYIGESGVRWDTFLFSRTTPNTNTQFYFFLHFYVFHT